MNYEFARPVTSSQQHTNQLDPELFPHAYNIIKDAQTGRVDGILKHPKTDPLIFHTQTSTEYWQKRGCLAHTDGQGNDLKLPENVRLYVIASAQHNSPFGSEPAKDDSQFLVNPLPAGDVLRALMVAMDLWVTKAIPPPPSRYPSVKDRTLVPPTRNGLPKIPGVNFTGLHNRQLFLDYGKNILRGKMDMHPPKPIGNGAYKILVPKSRCRRQRHRRHSPARHRSAYRHLHRLEPAAARLGSKVSCRVCWDRSFPLPRRSRNGARPPTRALPRRTLSE